jgi:hypothetical protein
MQQDNLLRRRRRRFVMTTDSNHDRPVYPNLAGELELTGLNQLWVADFTLQCAEQHVAHEGSSPSGARMRGIVSKSGDNASLARECSSATELGCRTMNWQRMVDKCLNSLSQPRGPLQFKFNESQV